MFLVLIRIAPLVESHVAPSAIGRSISWDKLSDGDILITEAVIWKCDGCEYLGMSARAGRDDLRISFAADLGSRPGGEFVLRSVRIQKPFDPGPIKIALTVRHRWNPFWDSRSHLFTIEYR